MCRVKILPTPSLYTLFLVSVFALSNGCYAQQTASSPSSSPSPPVAGNTIADCPSSAQKSGDLPEWKGTPLHLAVVERDVAAVNKLLKQKADPNERDNFGDTPLKRAVAMKILDPTPRPPEAVRREMEQDRRAQIAIVKALLKSGANVNERGIYGITPLIEVNVFNYPAAHILELANLLIENKADINLQDDEGYTALMLAAKNGNAAVVNFLLGKRADAKKKSCGGKTALDFAKESKNAEVVQILQNLQ